jgi:hypothetical protein
MHGGNGRTPGSQQSGGRLGIVAQLLPLSLGTRPTLFDMASQGPQSAAQRIAVDRHGQINLALQAVQKLHCDRHQ